MNNHLNKRINKISTDYHLKIKQCVDRVSQAHLQHIFNSQTSWNNNNNKKKNQIHNNSCSSIYSIAIEILFTYRGVVKQTTMKCIHILPMWSMGKTTFQIIMRYFSEKWLAKTSKHSNKNSPNERDMYNVYLFAYLYRFHFIRHFEAKIDNYLVFNHEINECYHCAFNLIHIMTSAIRKIVFTVGAA